jgi:hypothetical protein
VSLWNIQKQRTEYYFFEDPAAVVDRSVADQIRHDIRNIYDNRGYSFYIRVADTAGGEQSAREYLAECIDHIEETSSKKWIAVVLAGDGTLLYESSPAFRQTLEEGQLEILKSMSYIETTMHDNVSHGLYHFFINIADILARQENLPLTVFLNPIDSRGFVDFRNTLLLSALILALGLLVWFLYAALRSCRNNFNELSYTFFNSKPETCRRERQFIRGLRSFRKRYDSSDVLGNADSFTRELVERFPDSLFSVTLFGNDAVLNKLFGNKPAVLIVVDTWDDAASRRIAQKASLLGKQRILYPLFFTRGELSNLLVRSPMTLLYAQESSNLLWGADVLADRSISTEALKADVKAHITEVANSLRQDLFRRGENYMAVILAMQKLLIAFRSILYLRGVHKFTEWSWIVSVVESSCDINDLTLSEIVSALNEKRYDSLNAMSVPLIEALQKIISKIDSL